MLIFINQLFDITNVYRRRLFFSANALTMVVFKRYHLFARAALRTARRCARRAPSTRRRRGDAR